MFCLSYVSTSFLGTMLALMAGNLPITIFLYVYLIIKLEIDFSYFPLFILLLALNKFYTNDNC